MEFNSAFKRLNASLIISALTDEPGKKTINTNGSRLISSLEIFCGNGSLKQEDISSICESIK
jgi:hypothetical protein